MLIRNKLLLGFGLILLFIIGSSALTYRYVEKNKQLVDDAIHHKFNTSLFISQLSIEGNKLRRYEKEYFIYVNDFLKQSKYYDEWSEAKNKIIELMNIYKSQHNLSPDDLKKLAEWESSLAAYASGFENINKQVSKGELSNTLEANTAIADAKNQFKVFLDGTEQYRNAKFEEAKLTVLAIEKNFDFIYQVLLVAAIAGTILSLLLLFLIPSSITDPIEELTAAAQLMSNGNLDNKIQPSRTGDFRILSQALETLRLTQSELMIRYLASENYRKQS